MNKQAGLAAVLLTLLVGATVMPKAYRDFCSRHPVECTTSTTKVAEYDSSLMSKLVLVNTAVNSSIQWKRDELGDRWNIATNVGDCEDYALTKRQKLRRMGVPAGSMRIATARLDNGDGHAVLIVVTNKGEYVLDNIVDKVRKVQDVNYKWLWISTHNPRHWVRFNQRETK